MMCLFIVSFSIYFFKYSTILDTEG